MSIEKRAGPTSRSFRSLIGNHADMSKHIKDLKDLRILRRRACYRHSGPKGPEENKRRFFRSGNNGEGQALALREGAAFFIVARGPVPRDRWGARTMAISIVTMCVSPL